MALREWAAGLLQIASTTSACMSSINNVLNEAYKNPLHAHGAQHLIHDGRAAVDDDGAYAGLVGELAGLIVDLAGQLARGAQHQRQWVRLAAAPCGLCVRHQDVCDNLRACQISLAPKHSCGSRH